MKAMIFTNFSANSKVSAFLSLLIRNLTVYETICSVFIVNAEVNLPFPSTRYDETANHTVLNVDVKPDLYVSNLDFFTLEKYLNERSTSCSFNPKAIHLILTKENIGIPKNLSSYHAAKVVFVNTDNLKGYCELSKEILKSKAYQRIEPKIIIPQFETPTKLSFCCGDIWPPYQNCGWRGCSVKQGLFMDTLEYFAEYLNVTLVLSSCEKSGCTDYFGNFLDYDCDIVFGLEPLNHGLMSGYPPWIDDFDYWFVPRPSAIPHWKYMIVAFSPNIWWTWIFIIIFSSILKWSVERSLNKKISFKHIFDIFVLIFKIFLEQEVSMHNNNVSNMMFSSVLLSSIFILNLTYKTRFTYLLLGSNYYSSTIESLHDAPTNKLYVTYAEHLRESLTNHYPDLKEYLDSQFVHTDEFYWPNLVARNKNMIALKSLLNSRYNGQLFLDQNGRSLIDRFSTPVQKCNYVFYYKRSHPYWSRFPYFINALRDHGFLHLMEFEYQNGGDYFNLLEIDDNYELGLGDLEGPFMLWVYGNIIALIFFVIEIMRGK